MNLNELFPKTPIKVELDRIRAAENLYRETILDSNDPEEIKRCEARLDALRAQRYELWRSEQ